MLIVILTIVIMKIVIVGSSRSLSLVIMIMITSIRPPRVWPMLTLSAHSWTSVPKEPGDDNDDYHHDGDDDDDDHDGDNDDHDRRSHDYNDDHNGDFDDNDHRHQALVHRLNISDRYRYISFFKYQSTDGLQIFSHCLPYIDDDDDIAGDGDDDDDDYVTKYMMNACGSNLLSDNRRGLQILQILLFFSSFLISL